MAIEFDDVHDDTWYCTVCNSDLPHGDYDTCPKCGR